ncbi:MAG: hypothetical protein MJ191_07265 [Clostridium sp.]|nr:hypothetical protein [Clostridium sp.]
MNETIIAVIITGLVNVIIAAFSNSKTKALIEYKLEELTKRVDKHNNVIERTYKLEEFASVFEEKVKVANHRIDDLEQRTNAKK